MQGHKKLVYEYVLQKIETSDKQFLQTISTKIADDLDISSTSVRDNLKYLVKENYLFKEGKVNAKYSLPETAAEKQFSDNLDKLLYDLGKFLKQKNKKYGNSVLSSSYTFTKHNSSAYAGIYARIDDKISCIQNSNILHTNDVWDLVGYLLLLLLKKKHY